VDGWGLKQVSADSWEGLGSVLGGTQDIDYIVFQMEEFGKTVVKELKPGGQDIPVTEGNKREYVHRACNMKMRESIKTQIDSFLKGFYEIIPKELISIFNEQELELLICGLPTIDIDDLKANSDYHKYTENSLQVCSL
jgi:E3 ubiquitin-protein ligase HUWE1